MGVCEILGAEVVFLGGVRQGSSALAAALLAPHPADTDGHSSLTLFSSLLHRWSGSGSPSSASSSASNGRRGNHFVCAVFRCAFVCFFLARSLLG